MTTPRIVQQFKQGDFLYRLEYIKCGNPRCKKCALGDLHGPYWYANRFPWYKNKPIYIGRELFLFKDPEDMEKFKSLKKKRSKKRQKSDAL
jgi:hypothetical protein